jgi:hypothetical protein
MLVQRFMSKVLLVSGLLLIVGSCKDMGNDIPPPPRPIVVGQSDFTLAPGDSAATSISGGTRPYSVTSQSDTAVAVASVTDDSLRLRARSVGSSTIVVTDNGSPGFTATLTIVVTELTFAPTSVDLVAGDSASTTISGGTPPYSVVSNSDPSKALAAVNGTSLQIRALGAGTSTIIVGDGSSPRLRGTLNVNVTTAVSFSTQVQPLFSTNCVNAGCHPGGGAPFPLAAGVSYANLVNRPATNAPCAGDLRVQPSNADASALIKRLEGTCGAQMPFGGTPLPSNQIQLIRDWINQGARNN